ncbi:MAG: hypothetical protein HRF45_07830 [Fimbriimonadia bacterium]|jgi:hypothetical protein
MRWVVLAIAAFLVMTAPAQDAAATSDSAPKYSIESSGRDVRDAIHSLFTQARKNYILDSSVRHQLYMSVYDVEFDAAFNLLLQQAKLHYEIRDGVYYIGPQPVVVAPSGRLGSDFDWQAILSRIVTLKDQKIALTNAFSSLGKLAGMQIRVEPTVPNYLVNVSFSNVTLRYALDTLTKAAQLSWEPMLDGSIRIGKATTTTPAAEKPSVVIETAGKANVAPAPQPAVSMKCPNCKHELKELWKYCPSCGYWVKPITTKS